MGDSILNFFEEYLERDSLFKDKKVLQANYTPENIPHRENEIKKIASIFAPALKLEKPSNLFIYGKSGTGKTLVTKHVIQKMNEIAEKRGCNVKIVYINCKMKRVADTEYRLVAELCREFGQNIPDTGLPTNEVYRYFLDSLEKNPIVLIIVLDEIDQLIDKAGNAILYNFTRINSELEKSVVAIVGISNELYITERLDARVKSSLCEEEILFYSYDALQLKSVLEERALLAFREGVLEEGLIERCAALAAREHGDARRALELLRLAGEISERNGYDKVTISSLDEADEKIEYDKIHDFVEALPKQSLVALLSIFQLCNNYKDVVSTGDVYEGYVDICKKIKLQPLTQRRISDIIAELDMMGIIHTTVISKGRYGRTRNISIGIPNKIAPSIKNKIIERLNL